jgi:hypothetical protein
LLRANRIRVCDSPCDHPRNREHDPRAFHSAPREGNEATEAANVTTIVHHLEIKTNY